MAVTPLSINTKNCVIFLAQRLNYIILRLLTRRLQLHHLLHHLLPRATHLHLHSPHPVPGQVLTDES